MKRTSFALALVLLGTALAFPAAAAELAGVKLGDAAKVGEQNLVLNGIALRTKMWIKIYVAGLYLPAKQTDAAKVLAADQPRRMVFHFLYGVSSDQICEAWEDGLTANVPNASANLKQDFKTLCTWMSGVGKNVDLVLTYLPGTGTTVEVAGQNKGTTAGKEFADAVLSTWIGPNPAPGADFKKALLGG